MKHDKASDFLMLKPPSLNQKNLKEKIELFMNNSRLGNDHM